MTPCLKRRITPILFCFLISGFCFQIPARASCFNPTGNVGDTFYSNEASVLEYCNGGNWMPMGAVSGPPGGPLDGLVGFWKFDETSGAPADSSGNGQTGGLYDNATYAVGKMNNALSLDGNNDYVGVLTHASLDNLATLSISAWVKLTSMPSNHGDFADKGTGATGWSGTIYSDGSIKFYVYYGTTTEVRISNTGIITPGNWYNIVITWAGGTTATGIHMYVNGVEVGYSTTTNGAGSHTSDAGQEFDIGGCCGPSSNISGLIDDVRIYNRALSAAEIWSLYNNTVQAVTGLVGYWKLDDGAGTSAADSSSTGNTGTLVNAPTWVGGNNGGALTFDGTTQYVTIPYNAAQMFAGSYSIGAWIKATSFCGVGCTESVIDQSGTTANNYFLEFYNNKIRFGFIDTGSVVRELMSASTFSAGAWYHVVGVFDSVAKKRFIYINGVQDVSESQTHLPHTNTDGTNIGEAGPAGGGGQYFPGTVDEIRYYNRALSQPEVQAIYNGSKSCSSPTGQAGTLMYNGGSNHVLQTCGGGVWKPAGPVPGTGGGTCSSPSGNEGDTIFNGDYHTLQYCDGAVWRVVGGNTPIGGLIGWWNMDEGSGSTAHDSSGNGNDGTLSASNAAFAAGKIGNAISFTHTGTTSSGLITVANPANFAFDYNTPFTLSAWIYRTSSATESDIMGKEDPSNSFRGYSLWLDATDDYLKASFYGSGMTSADTIYTDPGTIPNNTWLHVAETYDGSGNFAGVKLYINGVSQHLNGNTTDTIASSLHVTKPFQIGAEGDGDGAADSGCCTFSGSIDDVRIYNRALSAAEVTRLYNGAP